MKRLHLLTLAFVLFCCFSAVSATQPPQQSPADLAAQQQSGAQHLGLLLGGKVIVRHGHYDFYNTDTHSLFRIENPAKAKAFKGDSVRIQGKVNAQHHTIYIYTISSTV